MIYSSCAWRVMFVFTCMTLCLYDFRWNWHIVLVFLHILTYCQNDFCFRMLKAFWLSVDKTYWCFFNFIRVLSLTYGPKDLLFLSFFKVQRDILLLLLRLLWPIFSQFIRRDFSENITVNSVSYVKRMQYTPPVLIKIYDCWTLFLGRNCLCMHTQCQS